MYPGERFNSITHLIGSVLALIGTSVAVTLAAERGGATNIVAASVYGTMLIVLYLSSTLYHSLSGKPKNIFRVFDHCSIYLLIAGTYTPFTLTVLRGPWGWSLLVAVWTLAIVGVIKDSLFRGRYRKVSVVLYLVMGWMVLIAFVPLQRALPPAGLTLLAAGGAVYTIGIVFYAMSARVAYTHGVWHLCVLAGSVCHYFAVVRYALR
jgi:hemolysin III